MRRIRSVRLRVALAVVLILGGVVIDLRFAAHPALSIGLLLFAAALFAAVGFLSMYRDMSIRRLRVGLALAVVLCLGGAVFDLLFAADPARSVALLLSATGFIAAVGFLIPARVWPRRSDK